MKQTPRQLKQKIRELQAQREDRAREAGRLQQNAKDVKAKLDKALHGLTLVSQGYRPANWTGTDYAGTRRLAANYLEEISAMDHTPRPWLMWPTGW